MDFTVARRPPMPYQDVEIGELIAIWDTAVTDLVDIAEAAGPDQWATPTPCPGWSVGDLVAHVVSLERFLMGRADPPHTPDYDSLPHAQSGLSRYTEIPVDLRRSRSRDDVLAEARATAADRLAELSAGPQSPDAEVMGVFGKPMRLRSLLRMRIFDTWIHEQDVRVAIDQAGHLGTPPAWVTAGGFVRSLAAAWAGRAGAPEGAVARFVTTGPEVTFDVLVAAVADGRGALIETGPRPDVTVELSWPDLIALGAGRVPPQEGVHRAVLSGDVPLAEALVTNLSTTP